MGDPAKVIKEVNPNRLVGVWQDLDALPKRPESFLIFHHISYAIKGIIKAPLTFTASVITGFVVYLVLTLGILILQNIEGIIGKQASELLLTIYLKENISAEKLEAMISNIKLDPRVEFVNFIDKKQALIELRSILGADAYILSGIGDSNPLPTSIEIKFKDKINLEETFKQYELNFGTAPETDRIDYSKSWLGYLAKVGESLRRISPFIAIISLIVVSFVIFNTAKLGLYAHRQEIEIMELLGAKSSFIGAPYVWKVWLKAYFLQL
mgnify:CR=1 FL=1